MHPERFERPALRFVVRHRRFQAMSSNGILLPRPLKSAVDVAYSSFSYPPVTQCGGDLVATGARMATQKLGRKLLKELPTIAQPTIIYDTDLKGFGLKLMPPSTKNPAGAKSWIVEYRPGNGGRGVAKKRVVLGSIGSLTPEQAREAAKTMLASVRLGADPSAMRAEKRGAKTIAELAPLYDAETNPLRKPRTVETYENYWRKHIIPAMGGMAASAMTKADVVKLHRTTGVDTKVTANRLVTLLAHFYEWAQDAKHVPKGHNPAKGVDRFKETGKERFLTPEELGRLGTALRLAETDGIPWPSADGKPLSKHAPTQPQNRLTKISPQAAGAIRLLIFTGARLREILHLEWAHVDFSRTMLFLPDSKSGKKPIVLGGAAVAVLKDLERLALAEARLIDPAARKPMSHYVFPTADVRKPKPDIRRPWRLIQQAADLPGVRLHDLRHSFASVGAGSGLGLPIIGKLLGHGDVKTTAKYAHLDANPLRRANDVIGKAIASAMNGVAA